MIRYSRKNWTEESSAFVMTRSLGLVDEMSDGINHMIEVLIDLMLPKSEDDPAFLYVMSCDIGIPFDVTSDFLTPKFGVRLR